MRPYTAILKMLVPHAAGINRVNKVLKGESTRKKRKKTALPGTALLLFRFVCDRPPSPTPDFLFSPRLMSRDVSDHWLTQLDTGLRSIAFFPWFGRSSGSGAVNGGHARGREEDGQALRPCFPAYWVIAVFLWTISEFRRPSHDSETIGKPCLPFLVRIRNYFMQIEGESILYSIYPALSLF